MKSTLPVRAACIALLFLLAACIPPAPQPEPTPAPTATAVVATLPPTPAPTAPSAPAEPPPVQPSKPAEPLPTLEDHPPLGDQLTGDGPWLLISASDGLWAANSDGSGLTRLTRAPVVGDLSSAVSPDGRSVAFIQGEMGDFGIHSHLKLYLASLPDGQVREITPLTSAQTEPRKDDLPGGARIEAVRAITDPRPALAWAPDGSALAFIGAQSGPTADLYLYHLDTGKIDRLTDGPAQAFGPSWSPLGTYIVQFGAETFGTGAGYAMTGAWAVPADGSAVVDLYKPASGDEILAGWLDDDEFLVYSWSPACGAQRLRIFNISGHSETNLISGCFSGAAVAPDGSILVGASGADPDWNGVYRFSPEKYELAQLSGDPADQVRFLPYSGDFVAGGRVYSSEGTEMARAPQVDCKSGLELGTYGGIYAWTCATGQQGAWINGLGLEERQIFDGPAGKPTMSPDNTLIFFSGGQIYHAYFPDYTPFPAGAFPGDVYGSAWAAP